MVQRMSSWISRYQWHLEQVPELLRVARETAVNPLRARRFDKDRVDGGGDDEIRLPFEVESADDADLLWAMLVLYGREVAELLGGSSPQVLRTAVWIAQEAQGLHAGISSRQAAALAADVCRWLVDRAEAIGAIAELGDAEEELFELIRRMRRRYGLVDRPAADRKRPCPRCRERGVVATWETVAGVEICRVFCLICRTTFEEEGNHDADLLAGSSASPALS
jgi:hypothetical protein